MHLKRYRKQLENTTDSADLVRLLPARYSADGMAGLASLKSKPGIGTDIMTRCTLLAALVVSVGTFVLAGDWPAFRGPRGNGISTENIAPLHWSPERNIRWKVPLPGPGNSSPIVSGHRVFVSCATDEGKNRGLYGFDRDNGKLLWSKIVRYEAKDPTHKTNAFCGSTPAADGEYVVIWHGSAGLHCYDFEGHLLWERDLGKFTHIWGYGSSPVFDGDRIFLNCGPGERSFVTAISARNGKTLWQMEEPGGTSGEGGADTWTGSWSTPVVATIAGRKQVLVSLPQHVNAYDPEEGKILWSCDGLGKLVYTSPVVGDGIAVAMGGYHGPAIGFRVGGSGNITATNRLWQVTEKNPQRIGTGIVLGNHLYMANEQHLAQCIDIRTGDVLWTTRMPTGVIWASPVLVGDRAYVTNQAGTTVVFRPNPERFELLAENTLGEQSNSTLAVSEGRIFLRTFENLYCIEEK
jgi:outer membrane protein assembly factor BamB